MTEKDLLKKHLKATLGWKDDDIASIYEEDGEKLKTDAFDVIKAKDAERITTLKAGHTEALTAKFNEGHTKAKGEVLGKFEEDVKKAFEIDSELKGVDLLQHIVSTKAEKKDTIDVKKTPEYLELEKNSIPKTKFEDLRKEFDTFKDTKEKESVMSTLKKDGRKIFVGLKPVLNKDKEKAENQTQIFLERVTNQNVLIQEDGNHILLNPDGKRKEDDHGHPIKFKDFVVSEAEKQFSFEKQDPKANGGNTNEDKTTVSAPSNYEEYKKAMDECKTPEERVALMEAYEASKA